MRRIVSVYEKDERYSPWSKRDFKVALREYAAMGSGLVFYKGEAWDWRMARYALEDLRARRKEQDSKA